MKYFAIIFLIGFAWITRDIIRVPENFNDSYFQKFTGDHFIDPNVSWVNQYALGYLPSFVISPFSDLFHLLGTIIIGLFFLCILKAYYNKWPFTKLWRPFWIWVFMFLVFGLGAFAAQGLWRDWLF